MSAVSGESPGVDRALEGGAAAPEVVAFSPGVAAISVAYVLGATLLWYAQRGHALGRPETIVPLYTGGGVVFFASLWALRGIAPWRLRRETWVVALSSFVYLALLWHYGRAVHYARWFGAPEATPLDALRPFFFFAACSVLARVVLPLLTARVLLGRSPRAYGYGGGEGGRVVWLYGACLLVALGGALYAATLPGFLQKYPLSKGAIQGGAIALELLLLHQLAYGLVFASGEAFWRGYILFGMERELGRLALFFMIIPYAIGHFGKPMPEAIGALFAGLVLGHLALVHRSFWWGVAVHWAVGAAMDLLALSARGVKIT